MAKSYSKTLVFLFVAAILLLLVSIVVWRRHSTSYEIPRVGSGRVGPADLYPNSAETPGATDPRVTQDNIAETICVAGWTKTVRPPSNVTNPIKLRMMRSRGLPDAPSAYELDHLIPLDLGGCPDCKTNLWLEPYEPMPGARQKDKVENYLHRQVCSGAITLQEAQRQIAMDWYKLYLQISPANP